MQVLLIDNFDSFTHNLVHALALAGGEVRVKRNNVITPEDFIGRLPDLLCLSPGPGRPEAAGNMPGILAAAVKVGMPVFGVCLGMQAICAHFKIPVIHAPKPMHGKASAVSHDGRGVFRGLPSPLSVGRYHSLCADPGALESSRELAASARTEDGVVMGVRHRFLPLWGVQFHPESILTPDGQAMVANAVMMAKGVWDDRTKS